MSGLTTTVGTWCPPSLSKSTAGLKNAGFTTTGRKRDEYAAPLIKA